MGDGLIWPVILSGGIGARLWPLSRSESPKQLLALASERTMAQDTALRTADRGRFGPPIVVTGQAHADSIDAQFHAVDVPPDVTIVEPAGRNTAPAIALAAHWLAARDRSALMLVMPSDHVITDVPAFHRAIETAAPHARDGWLITFGIRARTPETGYGYIRMGEPLGGGVLRVDRFVEKPALDVARAYVADGGYAWNGGIFLMRADRYLEELAAHAPAIATATAAALATTDATHRLHPDPEAFLACPSDSIDYAVMERAARVAVVPVDMGWSDIGSWDALHAIAPTDDHNNALRGDVIEVDSRDCLLRSEGPLIAAVGLEGITVVATDDVTLVMRRGAAQDVKKIVDRLKAAKRPETERPLRVRMAEGDWRRLVETEESFATELRLEPGARFERSKGALYVGLAGSAVIEAQGAIQSLTCGRTASVVGAHQIHSADGAVLIRIETRF